MSVNWRDEDSAARIKALAAAEASGEFDSTVPTWDIYCDLREALIWSLLATGFPGKSEWAITEKNWKEVFVRLHILERTRGCFRIYNNGNHALREMYFTPHEIKSMVGLSVNAGNKTNTEFMKHIFSLLESDARGELERFTKPSDRDIEDPYYWEKLSEPERRNK